LQNTVSGNGGAVFGYLNNVSGQTAFAAGTFNSASGQYSFASGQSTKAQGIGSFTSGYYTSASGDYQTVAGTFNELNTSPNAFIVGGGTSLGSGLKTLVFASGSQFQLSGSFAPQYRNITNVNTCISNFIRRRDY
jgi:trimeric autotransporter adhesin